jgi:hypothetical protein
MRGSLLLGLGAALLAGCDKNCQNTCGRIYSESECHVIVPGVTPERLREDCEEQCETALTRAGSMGSYNPYNRAPPDREVVLENERQAAAWMNCVWDVECSQLDPSTGICAPI